MAYVTSVERIATQEGMQQEFQKAFQKGFQQGLLEGKLELAIQIVRDHNLSVKEVAEKSQLPLQELKDRLNQDKNAD